MDFILKALGEAIRLILHPDREVIGITGLSLFIGIAAVLGALIAALPIASFLALKKSFPLKGFFLNIFNTLMGLPPVVAGLALYLVLSRSGPLGPLGLLYTPWAMLIAQFVLAFPIIAALSHSAIMGVPPAVSDAARTLGASPLQHGLTIIHEARFGIFSSIMAAFGRVMAEVGAVLIVGGNIKGYTRVMTTTIALETDKGEFELAMALGIVLLAIGLLVNFSLYFFQKKGGRLWA